MTAPATFQTIETSSADGVFTLTLNRPPLNILNIAMLEEIGAALEQAQGASILVLRGRGKAFSAGADVGDHLPEKVERMLSVFHGALRRLAAFEGVVVALVDGAALGGGCELVLPADVVLASANAQFGQPEIQLGVFAPVAMVLLPGLIPAAAARELLLSGRAIDAESALRLGLASRVFPAESFEADCEKYLSRLSGLSRSSLKLSKKLLRRLHPDDFSAKLQAAEECYLRELMKTPDAVEGCAAFLAKRKPNWER
ncbi:MAG: enoyl-CoA hydratase/isomerase family protein [Elusimicrobia bacterium]|nr:enoyl-CoA hydratase/isomerase family protein [Elusimicrobiota bacterium]